MPLETILAWNRSLPAAGTLTLDAIALMQQSRII